MLNWFAILLVVASFGIIVQMLRVFPAKNTPIYVYAFVFIGWFLPFVTIALVPYDVYVTLSGDGPKEFIYVAWDVLYWIIQSFCWLILPLLKRFMTAGEFTFLYKVRRALLNQLRYFMFLIAFLMIFIVYLAIVGDLNKSSLQTFLTALGSLWGMLLIIILMGYGVVAIPRLWWYKGDLEKSLNYLRLKAVTIDEQRIDVNYALDQLILAAIAYEKQVKNDEKLGVYMKKIMDRCPEEELEMNRTRTYNLPETGDATYQKLVNLNSNLKNTKLERIRLEW